MFAGSKSVLVTASTDSVRGRHSPLITCTEEAIIELINVFAMPIPIRAAEKSITKLLLRDSM
jgi:hypothetical protein